MSHHHHSIPPEQENELRCFQQEVAAFERNERAPDEFKKFRLQHGVYGIRDKTDEYMIRVKVPFGAVSPDQLEAVANVAERFTPLKISHITTRQDFQFHNVKQQDVLLVLRCLAESGLTTREACGNTVRNITCCPFAGTSREEVFDVTPHAAAVTRYFLRNPLTQNLPRKFKMAFEGCLTDHARVAIHDIGVVAKLREGQRGFQLLVGGGLGAIPVSAQPLEEWTPEELLIPSIEAVLRIFDRHGNRANRARARIKFLVLEWGIEEFRKQWRAERIAVVATRSGLADWRLPIIEETAPALAPIPPLAEPQTDHYKRWRASNIVAQRTQGYFAVHIRCPQGDISAQQLRGLADITRRFCGGRVRTTIAQNLLLRWVHESHLPNVFVSLDQLGLAHHGAETIADITRCPGADTCQLAITHSRGLSEALTELFNNGLGSDPTLKDISIKISGCPNSCGQHHIADIGFFGGSKTVDGRAAPHYRMLIGGQTNLSGAAFGESVLSLPAKRIPEAVRKLLNFYRDNRHEGENFHDFVQRATIARIKELLQDYTTLPSYAEAPQMYEDLGGKGAFKVSLPKR